MLLIAGWTENKYKSFAMTCQKHLTEIEMENALHAAQKAKQGESMNYFVIFLDFVLIDCNPSNTGKNVAKDTMTIATASSQNVTMMTSVVIVA